MGSFGGSLFIAVVVVVYLATAIAAFDLFFGWSVVVSAAQTLARAASVITSIRDGRLMMRYESAKREFWAEFGSSSD